jgi:hypothetical protein
MHNDIITIAQQWKSIDDDECFPNSAKNGKQVKP